MSLIQAVFKNQEHESFRFRGVQGFDYRSEDLNLLGGSCVMGSYK